MLIQCMKDVRVPTDIKVFLDDANQAYSSGIWYLLEEIFTENMGIVLKRINGVSATVALRNADIYVTQFTAGMDRICVSNFSHYKKMSFLLVLALDKTCRLLRTYYRVCKEAFLSEELTLLSKFVIRYLKLGLCQTEKRRKMPFMPSLIINFKRKKGNPLFMQGV